jgi:four helix bundle protein
MPYTYGFEKLQVWNEARAMVKTIYHVTEKYPAGEKYGLSSQMRRAAVSVVSNIAEGSGRTSLKDQAHFYQLAFSSLIELLNQLIISSDLGFISEQQLSDIRPDIQKISNKLNALRNSVLNKSKGI